MNSLRRNYEGKEIYGCRFLGTRLNLNPYTFSLCHEAQGGQALGNIKELAPETYYEALQKLVKRNENKESPCRGCDKGERYKYSYEPINYVCVCTSGYCNSSCVYCHAHFEKKNQGYDPIPYLRKFHEQKLFTKNCYFDWGGEPTLNPWFEETIKQIKDWGYRQRINTNAIIYSKMAEDILREKNVDLRISVDAGTEECFRFMKGNRTYKQVWEHIRSYCKVSDKVYIKYNICNYNSDKNEIEEFVRKCKENGVKHILVDAEINAYQPQKNAGPFYFTEKEFNAAHYLKKLAIEKDFDVQVSGYAFSVRAEYDAMGKLTLPSAYYDNLDYDILSNNQKVQTFPSIPYMIEFIKRVKHPVAIWGGGYIGKKCIHILKKNEIYVENVIDNKISLHNSRIDNIAIKSPKNYFADKHNSQIILAGKYWKEMLREINQFQYSCNKIYYLPECYYEYETI